MHENVVFSDHAEYRILFGDEERLRTKLSKRQVKQILEDPTRHIFLGKHKGSCHILFYSNKDQDHFIVIKKGRVVITLKPLNYYKGRFEITKEILEKSRKIRRIKNRKYIQV